MIVIVPMMPRPTKVIAPWPRPPYSPNAVTTPNQVAWTSTPSIPAATPIRCTAVLP